MPLAKTSRARIYTHRLNPINPEEEQVMKLFDMLKEQGYNSKQAMVDAMLFRNGATPEMFSKASEPAGGVSIDELEAHLVKLANELRAEFASGKLSATNTADSREETSRFAKNFARGIEARQPVKYEDVTDEP